MTLASHYSGFRPAISFELFPPKTAAGFDSLTEHVRRLIAFQPSYFTCTYGAGGSTQGATLEVLRCVRAVCDIPVASHLTCVGATVDQLRQYLVQAQQQGTDYIVALRGDPPRGTTQFQAVAGGLRYANELVELIRGEFDQFGIAVAGYPEVHQEAVDANTDLDHLKRKVDAGADVVITQLFYDNADFYRFVDRCLAANINVPIVPGILPVTNFAQASRIATMCKARIPDSFRLAMSTHDDPADQFRIGVEHARAQTSDLLQQGVPGIHYYVLNKSDAAAAMLDGLPRWEP
jgi:methylenetetrahydrofolate reductase (NADPH)